jgi:DNA-binding LacI/PurR family transcriptional regulator
LDQRSGIRAVAQAVGMSVSTVSRALNGYGDVNDETRRRIQETAEMLGYRPSYAAAMLRRNRTNTVTFVVSKPWTKYVDPYFLGILEFCRPKVMTYRSSWRVSSRRSLMSSAAPSNVTAATR